jgi:hypothetical protein
MFAASRPQGASQGCDAYKVADRLDRGKPVAMKSESMLLRDFL